MRDQGLEQAVLAAGGVSELARQIGISQPSVSNWTRVPGTPASLTRSLFWRNTTSSVPESVRTTNWVETPW